MRRALVTLTAEEAAVFSARAATVGAHLSLPAPPGAALLGWAAAHYSLFAGDAFAIFHSGRVRFSNAYPVAGGEIAWPIPRLLLEKKHEKGGVENGYLVREKLIVGHPERRRGDVGARPPQFEPLEALFITASNRVVKPQFGARLRTATKAGRAAQGQLFGFQLIDPSNVSLYRAVIEADDGAISHD